MTPARIADSKAPVEHWAKIVEFETLDSTNRHCANMQLEQVEEFVTVWARRQTAGVGQRGNRWLSEGGKNLTFSVVLHPTFLEPELQYELTKAVALAAADLVARICTSHTVRIKWPNDIYVDGRKICGILTENTIGRRYETSVCGIGLNVNQTAFGEGAPNATSLKLLTGCDHDLRDLLYSLLDCLRYRYERLRNESFAGAFDDTDSDYMARLLNIGIARSYLYNGETITATATGVSRWGHLQLTTASGQHIECAIKEIQLLTGH